MSQASEVELLMLELINGERTSRGLNPLVINGALNDASEDHSRWMLDNDIFSHTGANGSSATQRIEAADYDLEGSWATAENIGWQSERGAPGIADDVRDIHESLMASPGHRANLLNPNLEDIGIGVELGDFSGYEAVMITQNFGATDAVSDDPVTDAPDETPPVTPDEPVADGDNDDPEVIPVDMPDPEVPPVDGELPDEDDTPDTDEEEAPDDETPDDADDDAEEPDVDDGPGGCPVDVDDDAEDDQAPVNVTTETVTNTVTSTSIVQDGADPITIATDETTESEVTEALADMFDFCDPDADEVMDTAEDDAAIVTAFEGSITNGDDVFTTDDRAEFEMMLADLFEDLGFTICGLDMDFV